MAGIVVCVNARAADEGAKVLEAGGNAFDAAITTAFVQMVTSPFSCGVGGMVSAHLWKPDTNQRLVVDGLLRAGSKVSEEMWAAGYKGEEELTGTSLFEDHRSDVGYSSICAPGAVAALAEVHRHLGSLPWKDLLQPAAAIARQGFRFLPVTTPSTADEVGPYQVDAVTRVQTTAECARLFYREPGTVPAEGEVFQNPDYASAIQQLAERGADDMYKGDLADVIASDLEANGSFVTRDDLREYETFTYSPAIAVYRGHTVYTNMSPGGGPLLVQALKVLDGIDLSELEHSGADHLSLLASTLQLINQDRQDFVGDPQYVGHWLFREQTSPERADRLREAVVSGVVGGQLPPAESQDTTHVTVVDGDGAVACVTHSNGGHSGVVTPGLGFVYNNGMNRFDPRPGRPSSLAPRKARLHLMMPTIAYKGRNAVMALGAPGGNAILSALVQTMSNVADFDMSAVEAVSATRIHAAGSAIVCEARVRGDVVAELRDRGFAVEQRRQSHTTGIALSQLVTIGPDGELAGGSDPRGESGVAHAR